MFRSESCFLRNRNGGKCFESCFLIFLQEQGIGKQGPKGRKNKEKRNSLGKCNQGPTMLSSMRSLHPLPSLWPITLMLRRKSLQLLSMLAAAEDLPLGVSPRTMQHLFLWSTYTRSLFSNAFLAQQLLSLAAFNLMAA